MSSVNPSTIRLPTLEFSSDHDFPFPSTVIGASRNWEGAECDLPVFLVSEPRFQVHTIAAAPIPTFLLSFLKRERAQLKQTKEK